MINISELQTTQVILYNIGGEQLIPVIFLEGGNENSFVCKNNNGHWEVANLPNFRLFTKLEDFIEANNVIKKDNIVDFQAWKKRNNKF